MMKSIWNVLSAGAFILVTSPSAVAQEIDFAVEVHAGAIAPFGLETVRIADEIIAPFGAERWHVLGACSNTPNRKVRLETSIIVPFGAKTIHVVGGPISPYGIKKVCITNANALDRRALRLLKLID